MALNTCQIQQYDFHCEQQFEKQCGKGVYTPYDSWHSFIFLFVSYDLFTESVQPSAAPQGEDEGVCRMPMTST